MVLPTNLLPLSRKPSKTRTIKNAQSTRVNHALDVVVRIAASIADGESQRCASPPITEPFVLSVGHRSVSIPVFAHYFAFSTPPSRYTEKNRSHNWRYTWLCSMI